jgi:hypothetical protein
VTFGIAAAAVLALAIGLGFALPPVAQGWLIAFVVLSGIPTGSLVLLLIHRLVGGRWGEALSPALRPAALLIPAVAVAFLPVACGAAGIFPWAMQGAETAPGVGLYLNLPFFIIRAAIALGGWSVLAILAAQARCPPLLAGLGLVFYGVTISLVAVDWILSVDPRFVSTAFAATIAIQQILSGLAFAAVAVPEGPDARATGDLGSFLIAALLGVVYLGLMSYIVSWYGDLPDKAAWYNMRSTGGWGWTIVAALVVGAALPFALLLNGRLRRDPAWLRMVGVLILIGVALHVAWLFGPAFGVASLVPAALSGALLAGLSIPLARGLSGMLGKEPADER